MKVDNSFLIDGQSGKIGILILTVGKNCSSHQEKISKFKAEGREFANILKSLAQFIQTAKVQYNVW